MPGRLFLTATVEAVARHFEARADGIAGPGLRLDVGPGDEVLAVVADTGGRRLRPMRWGMIPMGRTNARGRPVLDTVVNARSETLLAKSAYRDLRRAILPVGGWYEWTGPPRRKTRWTIQAPDRPILAFAAIYDAWQAPGGQEVFSLATITCVPSPDVAPVHDRMPVILDPPDYGRWLGEVEGDAAALLRPLEQGRLEVAPAAP